jgi:NADH:ubiquinone oxidoreductase subunit F (NADH-binding)
VRSLLSPPPPDGLPRLLCGLAADGGQVGIHDHLSRWGALRLSHVGPGLIDWIEQSGLVGHGGAWFPVATKWRSVRGRLLNRPVVVANGAEGEPLSSKDALLLTRLPHLVLDGASLAAAAVGATRIVVYVPERLVRSVRAAVADRQKLAIDPVPMEILAAPDRFIAGQESSVVNAIEGRAALPSFVDIRPVRQQGVGGRPTLVQNVETLAHVALIARFGPEWFRGIGPSEAPGTMLLTITGRWAGPRIIEAPLGAPLRSILELPDDQSSRFWGALLGGYGGGWVEMGTLLDLTLSEPAAREMGATLGAGIVALLPRSTCPLVETAKVVRYLEQQSARQCGPCVNGLSEVARLCEVLASSSQWLPEGIKPILELCDLIEGRGACRHPDGAARFIRSALRVFGADVKAHLEGRPCGGVRTAPPSSPRGRSYRRVGAR